MILDADGKPIDSDQDREQWLRDALFGWLGHRRVLDALMRHGGASWEELQAYIMAETAVPKWPLRLSAYRVLSVRQVRQQIVRAILQDQDEDYEAGMQEWTEKVETWLQTPEDQDPGPMPVRPQKPPKAKEIMKGLWDERVRLEKLLDEKKKRDESPIIQP
jgi:hypothetical protein